MSDGTATPTIAVVPTRKGNVLIEVTSADLLPVATEVRQQKTKKLPSRPGAEPVGRVTDHLLAPITEMGDAIDAITSEIVSRLEKARPSELTIELKLGFVGEGKIPFIAAGKTEGAIAVRLTWKDGKKTSE